MNEKRYSMPDMLRGLLLISMIIYHTVWDIVYIFNIDIINLDSHKAYIWQQSICWCFILLSGFCWQMGKRKLKHALEVIGISAVISIVTLTFMPECAIIFGVLSAIGTGMLVMIPLDRIFSKINPVIGLISSFTLFIITRNINSGWLGFENFNIIRLPEEWYSNLFTAYLGFPDDSFESSDYFSVFPWLFLYQTGYFLYTIFHKNDLLQYLRKPYIKLLNHIGQHSLIIYTVHQPVIYILLYVIFK